MICLTRTDTKKFTEKPGLNVKPVHTMKATTNRELIRCLVGSVVECHT